MDRSARSVIIISVLLGISPFVYAQNSQEKFLRGNKAYRQKQWSDALSLYTSLEKKGRAVWYNMGNCFYKMGNTVKALICWKRAAFGASPSEYSDIETNIGMACKKLGVFQQRDQHVPWDRWANCLPPLPLQILFLLCWYALWFIVAMKPFRRTILYMVIIGLVCTIIVLGGVILQTYYVQRYERGIVMNRTAHLLSGPHEGYHTVCSVPLAEELFVYEKRPGWYKVSGNGVYGWIPFNDVEVI